jgi:hypothetical protein
VDVARRRSAGQCMAREGGERLVSGGRGQVWGGRWACAQRGTGLGKGEGKDNGEGEGESKGEGEGEGEGESDGEGDGEGEARGEGRGARGEGRWSSDCT